jgi:catechol 2,3-dioxygenase-like lactoylglutathione lyase family enzyme
LAQAKRPPVARKNFTGRLYLLNGFMVNFNKYFCPIAIFIKEEAMFRQHHVHLRCKDVEASRDFYVTVMGGTFQRRYTTLTGLEITMVTVNDTAFALSAPAGNVPVEKLSDFGWGVYQVAFAVDNVAEAVKTLQARGAVFKNDGKLAEASPGVYAAFLLAPDNVEIELMQTPQP